MAAKRSELSEEQPIAPDLYDKDFYQWTQICARLIRERRLDCVDLPNIAEEIRDLGKRDKRELYSRLIVLIALLLELQIQPERRSQSWIRTIRTQRRELELVLADSPSLRSRAARKLPALYTRAVEKALGETGIAPNPLPQQCPFTLDKILDAGFLPRGGTLKSMAALPVKVESSDKGDSDLNPKAAVFVPSFAVALKPTIHKSAQYRADDPSYFDDIKGHLLAFNWRADVKAIYITNGWHTEFKGVGGGMAEVALCDYRLNDDGAAINHWYPQLGFPPGTC